MAQFKVYITGSDAEYPHDTLPEAIETMKGVSAIESMEDDGDFAEAYVMNDPYADPIAYQPLKFKSCSIEDAHSKMLTYIKYYTKSKKRAVEAFDLLLRDSPVDILPLSPEVKQELNFWGYEEGEWHRNVC